MEYKIVNPNQNPEEIKRRITDMIGDDDITKYLGSKGHKNIIKYSDIKSYKSIDSLLPSVNSYKIVLIESEVNSGHWIVIMRYLIDKKPTIEVFNSYGIKPASDLNFIESFMNKLLGQEKDDLTDLLDSAKNDYDIIYNKKRFQSSKVGVNTCGRWVLLRILMMKDYLLNLYQFITFIDELKKKYDVEADVLVAMLMP